MQGAVAVGVNGLTGVCENVGVCVRKVRIVIRLLSVLSFKSCLLLDAEGFLKDGGRRCRWPHW